jgi:hypothetical protein
VLRVFLLDILEWCKLVCMSIASLTTPSGKIKIKMAVKTELILK